MSYKKKEIYLKSGEVCPLPEFMELGVKYHAATPLREYWWRPISDFCSAPIQRDVLADIPVLESGGMTVSAPVEIDTTPTCSKCLRQCAKEWTTKSRLIPCLSCDNAGKWHQFDARR